MQAATGTAGKQAEVVAHLAQLHGQTLEGATVAHIGTCVGSGLDQVGRHGEGLAGELGQVLGAQLGKAGHCIQAGANGGAAHVDLVQQFHVALEVEDFLLHVVGKGVEFLPAGHGHGILQLGASHLYGVFIFFALVAQCIDHAGEALDKALVEQDEGEAYGGGVHVVGRLAAVAVVVGVAVLVLALLVSHDFEGAVGNHLVGVHVHTGPCAALHHVDGEVLVQLALEYLAACL